MEVLKDLETTRN